MATRGVPPLDLSRESSGGFQPPLSLWRLVEERVDPHEQEEIKTILGVSLVDQSLELHEEVCTLMSILEEYKEETNNDKPVSILPEPPQQRERLVQEICFFVENIRDKANNHGMNPKQLLSRHNSSVIDYALETSRQSSCRTPGSRPSSASSRGSQSTPRVTSPDDGCIGDLKSMTGKLTYLLVDDVLQSLRSTLEEEIESLLQGITFLQESLDEEASFRTHRQPLSREPTLTELKEERASLEKELLTHDTPTVVLTVNKASFEPKTLPRMLTTDTSVPMGTVRRHVGAPSLRGPMRATHNMGSIGAAPSPPTSPSQSPVYSRPSSRVSLNDIAMIDSPGRWRRTVSPSRVKVVPVGSIHSPGKQSPQGGVGFMPIAPTPPKTLPNRPGTAERFRKLVLDCRDGT